MSKPKTELQVGDIWGVPPVEKMLDVRVINSWQFGVQDISYNDIGGALSVCRTSSFYSWVIRKKAVLVGRYDFETGKAIAVKK